MVYISSFQTKVGGRDLTTIGNIYKSKLMMVFVKLLLLILNEERLHNYVSQRSNEASLQLFTWCFECCCVRGHRNGTDDTFMIPNKNIKLYTFDCCRVIRDMYSESSLLDVLSDSNKQSFILFSPTFTPPYHPTGLRPPSPEWDQDGLRSQPFSPALPLCTAALCRQQDHLLKGTEQTLRYHRLALD